MTRLASIAVSFSVAPTYWIVFHGQMPFGLILDSSIHDSEGEDSSHLAAMKRSMMIDEKINGFMSWKFVLESS